MGRLGKWLLVGVAALAGVLAIAVTLTIGWRPLIGPKARPLSQACGMEAFEIDPVIKGHRFGRVESELLDQLRAHQVRNRDRPA